MASAPAHLRRRFLLAALTFVLVAVYGSWVPFEWTPLSLSTALTRFRSLGLHSWSVASRTDLAANLLLFVPIGFFFWAAFAEGHAIGRKLVVSVVVLFLSSLFSLGIEFVQLWFPPRVPSLVDVSAQVVGVGCGIAFAWLAAEPCAEWLRSHMDAGSPAGVLDGWLTLYVLGLGTYNLLPLDLTIRPEELFGKYKGGRLVWVPGGDLATWQDWWDQSIGLALFVPVGVWIVRRLQRFGPARPIDAFAWCGLAALAMELAQIPILSRTASATNAVFHTAGAGLGVVLARRFRRAHQNPNGLAEGDSAPPYAPAWFLAITAYSAFLLALYWQPFRWETDSTAVVERWRDFFSIPFATMLWGTEFNAMTQTVRKLFSFLILGLLLAIASRPKIGRPTRLSLLLSLGYSWSLALLVELGQLFLPDRTPDSTDVVLYGLGASCGLVGMRRLFRRFPRPSSLPSPESSDSVDSRS